MSVTTTTGIVTNGVIVPNSPLPEGTSVDVVVVPKDAAHTKARPLSRGAPTSQIRGMAVEPLVVPLADPPGSPKAVLAAIDASPRVPSEWVDELERLIADGRRPPTRPEPFPDEPGNAEIP